MKELEEERQLFLEASKKEKWRTLIKTAIGLMLALVFLFIYLRKSGNWGIDENFYKFESVYSLLNYQSIYFYIFLFVLSLLFLFFLMKMGKGYSKEAYQRYKKAYKKYIVYDALDELFEDVKVYEGGFSSEDMADVGLISIGTHYESDDSFKGKYKNVPFEAAEIYTYHEAYRDDEYKTVVDFYGHYYIFEFNKKFKGDIKVFPENKVLKPKEKGTKIADLDLENDEFNKKFKVITEDKHLAYYILTPQLMEKMLKLDEQLMDVSFAFIDNKIHIAADFLAASDLFEFDPYEKLNIKKEVQKVKKDMTTLMQIVDMLDLDNDLFK